MKLYLLTQNENTGYETYDSCVVCAKFEDEAKLYHPDGSDCFEYSPNDKSIWKNYTYSWANKLENIKIQYIGEAASYIEKGVVLASFNAG